jgi:hypothetical protein
LFHPERFFIVKNSISCKTSFQPTAMFYKNIAEKKLLFHPRAGHEKFSFQPPTTTLWFSFPPKRISRRMTMYDTVYKTTTF